MPRISITPYKLPKLSRSPRKPSTRKGWRILVVQDGLDHWRRRHGKLSLDGNGIVIGWMIDVDRDQLEGDQRDQGDLNSPNAAARAGKGAKRRRTATATERAARGDFEEFAPVAASSTPGEEETEGDKN